MKTKKKEENQEPTIADLMKRIEGLETEKESLQKGQITKSMSNDEILQKAANTTAELVSAGRLNDAQSDRFIDFVIDVTGLKDKVRVVRFRNDKLDIDKIGVGKRVALPKREAQDPGVRRKINTSKVTLQPEEIMVPWELTDEFVMENIEG